MNTRTKEAIRYLGYGTHAVDEQTLALIAESFEKLDDSAQPRIIDRVFSISECTSNEVCIEQMNIASKGLAKNMKGCEKVVLFAATLGTSVDLMLRRAAVVDMASAVILQACAAAMLEEYLDDWQDAYGQEMKEEGWYLRPRFSPGYGDFSIQHQKDILQMLDAPKRVGVTLTDGGMLSPTKSVTACIGLSREETACHRQGCEACGKADCIYRRNN